MVCKTIAFVWTSVWGGAADSRARNCRLGREDAHSPVDHTPSIQMAGKWRGKGLAVKTSASRYRLNLTHISRRPQLSNSAHTHSVPLTPTDREIVQRRLSLNPVLLHSSCDFSEEHTGIKLHEHRPAWQRPKLLCFPFIGYPTSSQRQGGAI
eukprot:2107400-Rhodomonas_salina.2